MGMTPCRRISSQWCVYRVYHERNGTNFKDNWVYAVETLFLEQLAQSEHRWACGMWGM